MLAILIAVGPSLAPPHSGYHLRGRKRGFEGWYHRLTLPSGPSFAFVYSIFDPADEDSPRHGVGVQLFGPDEQASGLRIASAGDAFWADEHALALGHTTLGVALRRPAPAKAFARFVQQGWQLTSTRHQGKCDDISWSYDVEPRLGWGGGKDAKQYSTAGWLAALPVFEPHYQILMAHGLASGHVSWRGQRYDFESAPAYTEKNWGGAFPSRWFWLQCNAFDGLPGVALTCAGGARGVPLRGEEDVAMIGVHVEREDAFYPFPNVRWSVSPWGSWRLDGEYEDVRVSVTASCDDAGTLVACPTAAGMTDGISRETFNGKLELRLWRIAGSQPIRSGSCPCPSEEDGDTILLEASTERAALEVGGGPWEDVWEGSCAVGEAEAVVLGADVPLEAISDWIPGL